VPPYGWLTGALRLGFCFFRSISLAPPFGG
jgi:hypothetical protein